MIRSTFGEQMPVTRVDNWLLFPGGYCRKMTLLERWKARKGQLRLTQLGKETND